MNNNPNNQNGQNNIDDILDILQKRKEQNIKDNNYSDSAPTRVDNAVIKSENQKPAEQPSSPPALSIQRSSEPKEQKPVQPKQEQIKKPTSSSNTPPAKPVQNKKTSSSDTSSGTGISLSDFDNIKSSKPQQKSKKKKFIMPGYAKALIYLVSVFLVSILISYAIITVANDTFAFVKPDKEITVSIEEGATLNDVARVLHEKEVIKYPFIYKIYTKLRMDGKSYYTGGFVDGEHVLNSNLGYDKLISRLAESTYSTEVVRVTIPEGYTVIEIIDLFVEKRVISKSSIEEFKDKLNTAAYEYDFLSDFDAIKDENNKIESDKLYLFEGYLFPDTYDFYVGENLDSVIGKLLSNFNKKFDESYYDRCKELGLTIDEAITLASMIEAEGNKAEDFYKISSVFHNRMNSSSFPFLNSDATTLYSFQGEKKQLDAGDNQSRVHPYNTYLNKGLPPGPICNPGIEAIHAALYPENTNYYYFYTASSNGVTYFSTNEGQHNTYIQKDKNGTLN